jgi:tail tube protein
MSQGRVGYKTKLAYGDGATPTEVFTEIAEQVTLEPANAVAEEVDFTNQDSPGWRKESKPTWIDGGELTCTCNYIPGDTTQEAVRDDWNAHTIRNWRLNIREPVADVIDETNTFQGYVKDWKLNTISPTEAMRVQFVVKVTGPETWASVP